MNLGELYKKLRFTVKTDLGESISIKELAEKIGLSAPRISELENNKREMSLTELKAYHKFFNVSFEYLLGETEISSANEDIQTACKVTGLSEASINAIQIINNDFDISYCLNMDILFENSDFMDMIHELAYAVIQAQALAGCKRELESMDNLSEYVSNTGFTEGTGRDYIFHNREYLVSKYRLEEIFKKICSDITSQATGYEYSDLIALNFEKEVSDNAKHNPPKE